MPILSDNTIVAELQDLTILLNPFSVKLDPFWAQSIDKKCVNFLRNGRKREKICYS